MADPIDCCANANLYLQLRARIAELQAQLESACRDNDVAQMSDRDIRGALQTVRRECKRLTAENQRLRADKERLNKIIVEAEFSISTFRAMSARDLLRSAIDAAKSREG